MNYIQDLREALNELLSQDDFYLLGEDIAEPYGGAFKVTKGLSTLYPDHVLQVPMSEQGFTGMGIGMALSGLKVVVEIMFGDFITLCADQLINHASKFAGLYDSQLHFVIRTPMGGYRGYGATHSQSLEKIFFGIPDVVVISTSVLNSPGHLIKKAVELGKPVVFLENKLDYTREIFIDSKKARNYELFQSKDDFYYTKCNIEPGADSEIAIVVYGGLADDAILLQENLYMNEEILAHVISASQVYPLQSNFIEELLSYKLIVVIEEGYAGANWGSELVKILIAKNYQGKVLCEAAKEVIIGASVILESNVLPDKDLIYAKILEAFSNE